VLSTKDYYLPGCSSIYFGRCLSTFWRNIFYPSSVLEWKASNNTETSKRQTEHLLYAGFSLDLQLDPEDRGNKFLRNVGGFIHDYAELDPTRLDRVIA
jgi:hypothetical protein